LLIKLRNREQNGNFQISKLENPIAMGIGTQPNFIDALPNNHGLTLPNKKCRGSLHFNGHLSLLGACLRGRGGGSAEYMSLYSM
jgi:hypothetical protein